MTETMASVILPVLFVAGLGRCGTTLAMTMLDAGGFAVTGPRPSYELPERWRGLRPDMDWLNNQGGRAVKWIDPTRCPTLLGRLPIPAVVLLMVRSPREQARSQVKLIAGEGVTPSRRAEKVMERSIRRDTPIMRAQMRHRAHVYDFHFEEVLAAPLAAACRMRDILDHHFGSLFDVGTAAQVVINRAPECQPHMTMETMIQPLIAAELEKLAVPE